MNINKEKILAKAVIYPINTQSEHMNFIKKNCIKEGDIAFIAKYKLDERRTLLITDSLCESLSIGKEELFNAAIENTANTEYKVTSIDDMFSNYGIPIPSTPLLVVTSETIKAPALLSSDKVLKDIADKIDDDYWIFPSSTEEFIIVPKYMLDTSKKEDVIALVDIVRQVNREEDVIKDGVFLSDNLYQYDRDSGFSMVDINDYEQDIDLD